MERPRIPTARRKPSVKRMDMESNTLVDVELNQENTDISLSRTNQLERRIHSNINVVAPPRLPKKEPEFEPENNNQQQPQSTSLQQQINERVLSSNRNGLFTRQSTLLQQQINERVLSSNRKSSVQIQQQQQGSKAIQTNGQVLSNRKWAQVLGCPMNENQLLQEQLNVSRMAKVKGARQKDIDFMLEQMKTVPHIEMIQQQNNKPLDYIQRRLLLQSTRSSVSMLRRRTTNGGGRGKLSITLN